MAIDIEQVLAKVQKMLNVEGRTPEEAAAYVTKAHELLAKYDLTMDDIGQLKSDPRTSVARSDAVASKTTGKPDGWKVDLLRYVATAFDCKIISTGEYEYTKSGKGRWVSHYNLVGFKHDLQAAKWAYTFLVEEIVRQSKAYSRTHWDAIAALAEEQGISHHDAESQYARYEGTHPLKAEIYFVKGATQTISHALYKDWQNRRDAAVAVDPNALMVMKGEEIDDFIGQEQYGDKWPEVKARRAEQKAIHEQALANIAARKDDDPQPKAKPETPAQARKREEREAREYERWARKQAREYAKMDTDALYAGQKAGQSINWKEPVK